MVDFLDSAMADVLVERAIDLFASIHSGPDADYEEEDLYQTFYAMIDDYQPIYNHYLAPSVGGTGRRLRKEAAARQLNQVESLYYEVGEHEFSELSEYAEVGEALPGLEGGAYYPDAQPEPDVPLYQTLGAEGIDFYDTAMAQDMGPMYDEGGFDYHDVAPEPEVGTYTMAAQGATESDYDHYAAGAESLFINSPELFAEQTEPMYAMGAEAEATYASASQEISENSYGAVAEEEETYAMGAEDTYAFGTELELVSGQASYAVGPPEPRYGLASSTSTHYPTLRGKPSDFDSDEAVYGIASSVEVEAEPVYSTATLTRGEHQHDDTSEPTYSVATLVRDNDDDDDEFGYHGAGQSEPEYGLASGSTLRRESDDAERYGRATQEVEPQTEAIYALGNEEQELDL
jgi:hypothetical protein